MNYISIIGLLVLLSGAWLMSYHRSDVKLRPIILGISLQLLFALIILREDMGSFIGMSLLSILIIIYIQQKDIKNMEMGIKSTLIIIIASLAVGYTLFILPTISKFVLIIATIFFILSSYSLNDAMRHAPPPLRFLAGLALRGRWFLRGVLRAFCF